MDQSKTGAFIAAERTRKGLTQKELAQRLDISDKTVSKWETGRGFPEVSLLMPLCEQLEISVNELLSGRRLDEADYRHNAEVNMVNLVKETQESKKKIWLAVGVILLTLLGSISLLMVSGLTELEPSVRTSLLVLGLVILALGLAVGCVMDREAGYYECRRCGHRFVPEMGAYVMGVHSLTTRRLKCPHCGEITWAKRRLTKTK